VFYAIVNIYATLPVS